MQENLVTDVEPFRQPLGDGDAQSHAAHRDHEGVVFFLLEFTEEGGDHESYLTTDERK